MRAAGALALIAAVALTAAPAARAAQAPAQAALSAVRAQLNAAWDVSDLAQEAATVEAAHHYLRQIVNCLEGPGGRNYSAAAGNPCQRLGNGALVDLRAVVDGGNVRLGRALRYAQAAHFFALDGLASTTVERAQTFARIAAFDIGNALEALD